MKRVLLALCSVIAICGVAAPAFADDLLNASADATFRRGNQAYFAGKYEDAIAAYEQVAALDVISEDLFYNLGNAYLKSGKLGPAIYNYERALELDPTEEDVIFNLQTAKDSVKHLGEDRLIGAEVVPLWIRIVQPYRLGLLSWLFVGVYSLSFLLLIFLRYVGPGFLRVSLWAVLAFVGIATIASGGALGARVYLQERVQQAIVLPDRADVKEGPDPNYSTVFSVHAGLKVRITDKEQDWVRVRLVNGLEGWLRERDLGRL